MAVLFCKTPIPVHPGHCPRFGRIAFGLLMTVLCLWCLPASGADGTDSDPPGHLVVRVAPGQSLRDIARQYLNDPNRWTDLLRANGLGSAHDVQPGMQLKVPAAIIFDLEDHLDSTKHLIQKATAAGARLFAPQLIAAAIEDLDTAIEQRNAGQFAAAGRMCRRASSHAQKAHTISDANQHSPAEAVVQNLSGQVHRRKPADNIWKPLSRFELLQEGEKVRTLSASFAEILFRDNSRLHLSENAQALIQKMRANLLDNSDEAKVSLIKGDVLALLSHRSNSASFQLDVPGVNTNIKSQHFWVARDRTGARFANYDGEMEISSGGQKVVLAENQGTIVPTDQKPLRPRRLLARPVLLSPQRKTSNLAHSVWLEWQAVSGAAAYLLEVSRDGGFAEIIFSKEMPQTRSLFPAQLGLGAFYWRVTALSATRLRGRPSEARFVWVMDDRQPPYLVLHSPQNGKTVTENFVEINGTTEEDVRLNVQGQLVDVQAGGDFRHWLPLEEGDNQLVVKAVDPFGNVTTIKRQVNRVTTDTIPLRFAPTLYRTGENRFKIGQRDFVLAGTTCPKCHVRVLSEDRHLPATTVADDEGQFRINLQMIRDRSFFDVAVTAPDRTVKEQTIAVEVDDTPPQIQFAQELPPVTAQRVLTVAGTAREASYLELNGEILALVGGRFHRDWYLNAGLNRLSLLARDSVGNVAMIEKEVVCDIEPPVLLRHRIDLGKQNGVWQASIDIWVEDATGMKKTAPFNLQIGGFQTDGHLILTGSDGRYSAALVLPDAPPKGERQRLQVELADYLGNRRTYER